MIRFLILSFFLITWTLTIAKKKTHTTTWIESVHTKCFSANSPVKISQREGFGSECKIFRSTKKGPITYIVSAISKFSKNSIITFGPELPNGHPKFIKYETTLDENAMSVAYVDKSFIFVEATDFGVKYFVRIKTPDQKSASCYQLQNGHSITITLLRKTTKECI